MGRILLRNGVTRGFLGGSRVWTVVGVLAVAHRLFRRLTGRVEKVVLREELLPGAALVIASDRETAVVVPAGPGGPAGVEAGG